jgi:hypothetical protein
MSAQPPDLDELSQRAAAALEKHVTESIQIDKAWRGGKLSEWVAANLEAERKAFYGDGTTG